MEAGSPALAPTSSARARPRTSPRHRKPDARGKAEQVQVTGFPPFTQPQDLIHEFSKFGDVSVDVLQDKFAILKFPNLEQAQRALRASGKVEIYGEFVVVKPYTNWRRNDDAPPNTKQIKRDFVRSKQKGVIIEPKDIDLSGDFYMQAERILASVRLTQEEATTIGALYSDVEKVLQAHWPGCVAVPFGSITTGLGIKTSDADCFLQVPQRFQHNSAGFVNKARRVLDSYPNLFAEILSIPRANTPIVKFFHIPTETNCDLSFKTPLGSQNSRLIAFLLHADPRLIPVAVLIKYWAKVHGLSGTGKLTNYALTMMIIFYVQQPPLSILPSVAWLQRDPGARRLVDYWRTDFAPDKDALPPCTNTSTTLELFGGFFEYYSTFNFDEMVVCPYLGTTIKKQAFQDVNNLPAEYDLYKYNVTNELVMPMRINSSVCVQDPFEQSHNVASGITNRFAVELKAFIKFAAVAYEKDRANDCENFLKVILLQQPKLPSTKNPEFRIGLFPKLLGNIADPDWKTVVRDTFFTIFEKMLKLKLEQAPIEENREKKSNPESRKQKEKYTTIVSKPIWKRKQFNKLYGNMKLEFTEKHTRITEEIMNVEKTNLNVKVNVVITFINDPRNAVVTIKQSDGISDAFREFGKFFKAVVDNWVVVMLRPYLRSPQTNARVQTDESGRPSDGTLDNSNECENAGDNELTINDSQESIVDNGSISDDDELAAKIYNGKCDIKNDSNNEE